VDIQLIIFASIIPVLIAIGIRKYEGISCKQLCCEFIIVCMLGISTSAIFYYMNTYYPQRELEKKHAKEIALLINKARIYALFRYQIMGYDPDKSKHTQNTPPTHTQAAGSSLAYDFQTTLLLCDLQDSSALPFIDDYLYFQYLSLRDYTIYSSIHSQFTACFNNIFTHEWSSQDNLTGIRKSARNQFNRFFLLHLKIEELIGVLITERDNGDHLAQQILTHFPKKYSGYEGVFDLALQKNFISLLPDEEKVRFRKLDQIPLNKNTKQNFYSQVFPKEHILIEFIKISKEFEEQLATIKEDSLNDFGANVLSNSQ
jgi:hypothetical protein